MVLRTARRGSHVILAFDRPESKNAINREMAQALEDGLALAEADASVTTVVLASSSADVFLSGGDLREMLALGFDDHAARSVLALGEQVRAIERCALPVIAAVSGQVIGGGCELLMMCDHIVLDVSATVRFVHARMGLVPAWGGATRLAERIGGVAAADMISSARQVGAKEALGMGLVDRVADAGDVLGKALDFADTLTPAGREALVAAKHRRLTSKRALRGEALEVERRAFLAAWGSAAHRRAFDAFIDKRR